MMGVSEYYSGSTGTNVYLSVILYSVVIMTAFRFFGSIAYLLLSIVDKIVGRKSAQVKHSATILKSKSSNLFFWRKRSRGSNEDT